MDRRNFLKNSSVAGLSIATLTIISCNEQKEENKNNIAASHNEADDFALNEATIDQLQQKMQTGEYSSRSLTEMYMKRIEQVDKNGPKLNAVIELNPDALTIADDLDKERKAGKIRGPLHGIPVLIKDNINSGDRMQTTAGALALSGNIASKDAFIIQQLRNAGAVLLGKTNLSEWANFRSTSSTSGWSSRGGQTKNPVMLDRNTSGSSSGSGSAVAANLCVVAIGTETDGSIVSPASINGIVGIKPTVGLWSRSGIIPISKTQDTAGPMARTVKDAAILLGALTGVDAADSVTNESKDKAPKDYTSILDKNALQGKRIGIDRSILKVNPLMIKLFDESVEILKKQGAVIVEIAWAKAIDEIGEAEFTVLKYEFKEGVNKYLATANAKVKTLAEVIAFNKTNESTAMPWFKQEILESCEEKGDLENKEYKDAIKKTMTSRKIIDDVISLNHLDAICTITGGPAWCTDLVNGDHFTGAGSSGAAAMAGYPHITVPMGKIHELPIGISFFSGAYKEPEILAIAYAYEQATKKRATPKFLKAVV